MKDFVSPLDAPGSIASAPANRLAAPEVALGVNVSPQGQPMGARKADLTASPILDALSQFTGRMLEMDGQARAEQQKQKDQRAQALQNLYNEKMGQDAATDLTTQVEALKADPERLAKTNVQEFASNIARQHEAKLGRDNLHALQPLLGAYTSAIKDANKEKISQAHEAIVATHFEDVQKNLLHTELVTDPATGQQVPQLKLNPDVTMDHIVSMIDAGNARGVPTAGSLQAITEAAKQLAMNGDTRLLEAMDVPINKPGWDGLSLSMKADAKGFNFRAKMDALKEQAVSAREKAAAKQEETLRYKTMTELDQRLADDPMSLEGVDTFKIPHLTPSDSHQYALKVNKAQADAQEKSQLMALAQQGALPMATISTEKKQQGMDAAYADSAAKFGAFSDQHIDDTFLLIQNNRGSVPSTFSSTLRGVSQDAGVDPETGQLTGTFNNSWKVYQRAIRSSNPNIVETIFDAKDVAYMRRIEGMVSSGRAKDLSQAVKTIKENSTPERMELNQKRMAAISEDIIKGIPDAMSSSGWLGASGIFPHDMKNFAALKGDAHLLLQSYAEIGLTDPAEVSRVLTEDLKKMYVDDGNQSWVKVPRGSTIGTDAFVAAREAGRALATRMGVDADPEDITFQATESGTYRMLAKGMMITRPDGKALSISPDTMQTLNETAKSRGKLSSRENTLGILKQGAFKDIANKFDDIYRRKENGQKLADKLLEVQTKADQALLSKPSVTTPIASHITQTQAANIKEAIKSDLTLGGILTQEDFRTKVYTDKSGHPTIGMGYNLDKSPEELQRDFKDVGIMPDRMQRIIAGKEEMTQQEALALSSQTVDKFKKGTAKALNAMGSDVTWDKLSERHQAALTMLAYNTGPNSPVLKEALQAISEGNAQKFAQAVSKVGYMDKDTKKFVSNTRLIQGIQAMAAGPVRFNTYVSYPKSDYAPAPGMKPAVVPGGLLPQLPMAKAK